MTAGFDVPFLTNTQGANASVQFLKSAKLMKNFVFRREAGRARRVILGIKMDILPGAKVKRAPRQLGHRIDSDADSNLSILAGKIEASEPALDSSLWTGQKHHQISQTSRILLTAACCCHVTLVVKPDSKRKPLQYLEISRLSGYSMIYDVDLLFNVAALSSTSSARCGRSRSRWLRRDGSARDGGVGSI